MEYFIKFQQFCKNLPGGADSISWYHWLLFPQHDITLSQIQAEARVGNFPTVAEVLYPAIVIAAIFGLLRTIFTKFFFKPLALWAMKLEEVKFTPDKDIDKILLNNKPHTLCCNKKSGKTRKGGPDQHEITAYCKEMNVDAEYVNHYLWGKRRHDVTSGKIVKFIEAFWRFIFYSIFCIMGIIGLFYNPTTKEWIGLGNTELHWKQWPFTNNNDHLDNFLKFYYIIELGCYIHQLWWTEVNRKDATEMIVHHCATICLISFSWVTNFSRIGSSILLTHDLADIFLESAKCISYASKVKDQKWLSKICDILFAIFALTFGYTRLYIYPKFLVNSLLFESNLFYNPIGVTPWIGYWVFAGLLSTLQVLHVFWFYLIVKMVYQLFTSGIDGDVRSESDEEPDHSVNGSDKDNIKLNSTGTRSSKRIKN
jgi:hypothetical protein